MAYSITPTPGGEFLCAEPCEHRDCKALRELIASKCGICGEPIGEGRQYCRGGPGGGACHFSCLCDFVDAEREG